MGIVVSANMTLSTCAPRASVAALETEILTEADRKICKEKGTTDNQAAIPGSRKTLQSVELPTPRSMELLSAALSFFRFAEIGPFQPSIVDCTMDQGAIDLAHKNCGGAK